MIEYGFGTLEARAIFAGHRPANEASGRLMLGLALFAHTKNLSAHRADASFVPAAQDIKFGVMHRPRRSLHRVLGIRKGVLEVVQFPCTA